MIEHSENLKVSKPNNFFVQEDEGGGAMSPRDFKPLASPTTPFQFEATQRHDRYQQQQQQQQQQQERYFENPSSLIMDDDAAARIQSTIQLQLLSYIRSLHGVQQHQQRNSAVIYSQPPGAPIIPDYFQQQQQQHHHHHQQHPTLALLQQRFQRLERDKEMRHTKQLFNSSSSHESLEHPRKPSSNLSSSIFPPPPPSSSSSSNPHRKDRMANLTRDSTSLGFPVVHPGTPAWDRSTINRSPGSMELEDRHLDHLHGTKSSSNMVLLSLLDSYPAEDDGEFSDQSSCLLQLPAPAASNSSSSPLPRGGDPVQQPYRSALPKDWRTAKRSSIASDDDGEVDTSLHL